MSKRPRPPDEPAQEDRVLVDLKTGLGSSAHLFSDEKTELLAYLAKTDTSREPRPPNIRVGLARLWIDVGKKSRHLPPDLDTWLVRYTPEPPPPPAKNTIVIEYRIDNPWGGPEAVEREALPVLAIEFLNLVNPRISITRSKHDYWQPYWHELVCKEMPSEVEMAPEEWKEEGSGYWYEKVFYSDLEDGWEYFLHHQTEEDQETMHKEVLRLCHVE